MYTTTPKPVSCGEGEVKGGGKGGGGGRSESKLINLLTPNRRNPTDLNGKQSLNQIHTNINEIYNTILTHKKLFRSGSIEIPKI